MKIILEPINNFNNKNKLESNNLIEFYFTKKSRLNSNFEEINSTYLIKPINFSVEE